LRQYKELLSEILTSGADKTDRTGTGTYSIFGYQMRFNLEEGFPLITTKKVHWKSVVHELLWFISGKTNIQYLKENKVSIWDAWADEQGELGPVYGKQWRRWETQDAEGNKIEIDQLANVIRDLKNDPFSRRHIISAWNVGDVTSMALPPCHMFCQFYSNQEKLSCLVYMRSVDCFLGLPFNIASYALLLLMVSQCTGLQPYEVVFSLGDAHLYKNHIEQTKVLLEREPFGLPVVKLNPRITNIDDFTFEDIALIEYEAHPHIKAVVSV
jgi:thymidylate synthase